MDEYRKAVVNVLKATKLDDTKLGGRELLDLLIRKWYSLILLKRIVNYGIYPLGVYRTIYSLEKVHLSARVLRIFM